MRKRLIRTLGVALGATCLLPFSVQADTISPETFSADLAVGESVTVRKTVTVEAAGPSGVLIDVHFLFDTSGSMGGEIANAKAAAADILSGLGGLGDLAVGVGVYSEGANLTNPVPGNVINQDLTTDTAVAQAAINDVTRSNPDGGGDFPERGQDATFLAAENVSWRPGSRRFIVSLADAPWKNDQVSDAEALAALTENNVDLIGLRYRTSNGSDPDSDDTNFTQSIEDLGGTVFTPAAGPDAIVEAILEGVEGSFSEYSEVTVDVLDDAGLPEIAVSTVCVSADSGSCDGALAVGDYDRSEDRTFEFDVTFTREADGDTTFDTYALVDGAIVATEVDTFGSSTGGGGPIDPPPPIDPPDDPPVSVPEPGVASLLSLGLIGSGFVARRRRRA